MTTNAGYDYVIIGAGSAGCALARRLSDLTDARILVLEAGGSDDHPDIHDPSGFFRLWSTEVDWGYVTVPQPATDNRSHRWPRGRVLGGTSSINGMVYIHGDRADYDTWAYLGNAGWSYADVRRAFDAMEGRDVTARNGAGPPFLAPAVVADRSPLSAVFLDACEEVGIPRNDDLNGGDLLGAGWNQSTIAHGRRQSAYRAFLAPLASRETVTVVTNARVQRLHVDSTGTLTSVTYLDGGAVRSVAVDEEVIVCAGAVDSPRLLMLSGIGPADELAGAGITPVIDVPEVGRNLVDHMLLGVVFEARERVDNRNPYVTESCAFVRSAPGLHGPDIEISFAKEECYAEGYPVPANAFTIIPGIVRPESRGLVTVVSPDPSVLPIIDPRHLSEEADMRGLLRGIEISREIGNARAFAPWAAGEVVPGPDISDERDLRAYVRDVVSTWFHPAGTCRMGIDSRAVVSPGLRLAGTTNVRVADASVMPHIVSSNTNAASMMIGWRAAELIAGEAAPNPREAADCDGAIST
jgi:choline dehydrogenase